MKQNGFTIIELVISIFILSVAVVGIFSAFSIITILTSDAADRLTATYLVQEGMEIIRNIRDTNWLNMDAGVPGATWLNGLTGCSGGCEADYITTAGSNPVMHSSLSYLYLNTSGFYCYPADGSTTCTGAKTKFQRKITITHPKDAGGNDINYIIKVVTQVSWDEKATILNSFGFSAKDCYEGKNCITAQWTLYNWYNTSVPSSDATVTSSIYIVNSIGNTITGVAANTAKADFLANLTLAAGAAWDTSDISSTVATNDTLVVTAQDGSTKKTYTISVP
jgi:prepilin-type N-terminal cleavage/methylation domain-containing protein